jgi:hypothetical protein
MHRQPVDAAAVLACKIKYDSMKLFQTQFKLYSYKNKDKCDLSIKVSDEFVLTFKLTHHELKSVLSCKNTAVSFDSKAGQYWLAMDKAKFQCIRLTISNQGMEFNFRVRYEDFDCLRSEYENQQSSPQSWD